jgi:hypothetical protein
VGQRSVYRHNHYRNERAANPMITATSNACWASAAIPMKSLLVSSGSGFFSQTGRCSRVSADCFRLRGIKTGTPMLWLSCLVLLAALASSSQVTSSTVEIKSPDLNLILEHLEDIQHQDPAQSRPYQVTREYKVFRGYDNQPTSEVMAQIDFVPPDTKTYKIIQAKGNSLGEKMVRELLDRETESSKKGHGSEISRTNYDFVFLRRQNFGVLPEYVLGIFPKRKDKYLLRGQIWVDASTFRIHRIEGVPAKSPSLWLKNIHITLQFAQLGGMWVPVTFDSIATVRFLGQYTLAGLNIRSSESPSTAPK